MKKHITDKYKFNDYYICECGKQYKNAYSLGAHFGHCVIHNDAIGSSVSAYHLGHKGCMSGWQNKSQEEIKNIYKRANETQRLKFKNGAHGTFYGKHHSEETKRKMRESTIKYINENCGGCRPRYSVKQCKYLDKLAAENNWNIRHAMNGGEFFINGYFVDGYVKELNIVIEYDEKKHYIDVENNILRKKDIIRQENIIKSLNCKFYRYNEVKDELYEVKLQ